MAGILYLAVINQFLNQEHDVRRQFEEMIRYESTDIKRINLPVELEPHPTVVLNELAKEAGIKEIFVTREIHEQILLPLMFSDNLYVAEQFRIINAHLTMALARGEESMNHRTLLMVKYLPS